MFKTFIARNIYQYIITSILMFKTSMARNSASHEVGRGELVGLSKVFEILPNTHIALRVKSSLG